MFISVDLPAPFSPSSACTSPRLTSSDTSSLATMPGNALRMPRISRTTSSLTLTAAMLPLNWRRASRRPPSEMRLYLPIVAGGTITTPKYQTPVMRPPRVVIRAIGIPDHRVGERDAVRHPPSRLRRFGGIKPRRTRPPRQAFGRHHIRVFHAKSSGERLELGRRVAGGDDDAAGVHGPVRSHRAHASARAHDGTDGGVCKDLSAGGARGGHQADA